VRRKLDKCRQDPAASLEEKDSLAKEHGALGKLVESINKKETLNFFTDAGLIPNYAFPETGVVLHSVIYRKKEKNPEGGWDTKEYEYQRSARSAISELVPGNVFYANGRHVTIDQVDVELSKPESWRFCPGCNHMEMVVSTEQKKECPRCGSQGWFDGSQVQSLLKVKQVFANTNERDSLTRDDDDEREKHFYLRHLFVDFEPDDVEGAWSVENEDITFGFQFIGKTTFREINFGEQLPDTTHGIMVAGQEYPATGFIICRHCGTIQDKRGKKTKHAHFCTARDKETEKNFEHMLFLYRDFQSESICFLVPAITDGADRKMQSFLAALRLGLREQYRGDIDHLATSIYDEPVPNFPSQRKRYVVLYDTVPGGTGYLKQITKDKDLVFGILEKALRFMQECSCRKETSRDGCYRCLLAYRNSRMMDSISRQTAEELLVSILKNRDAVQKVRSLSAITMNKILESELEKKFLSAIDERVKKEGGEFSLEIRGSKPWYKLDIFKNGKRWLIEPQCEIKTADKKEILCRADFVFHPNGFDGPKIVVFTDGLFYHKERIGLDMRQRMTLLHHPDKYITWSLTWKDIERFQNGSAYEPEFNMLKLTLEQKERYFEFCRKLATDSSIASSDATAMHWFFDFLKKPDAGLWMRNALAQSMARMSPESRLEPDRSNLISEVKAMVPDNLVSQIEVSEGTIPLVDGLPLLRRGLLVQTHLMKDVARWPHGLVSVLRLDDRVMDGKDFEFTWNEMLRLVNLYQFLPWSLFLSQCDFETGGYETVTLETISDGTTCIIQEVQEREWQEVFSIVSSKAVCVVLEALYSAKTPIPIVGYELVDTTNRICGVAELAWENVKVAYMPEAKSADAFKETGWKIFLFGEESQLIASFKE
jgi:DEAD/DEAH box helicase domain-containing protein